LENGMAVEVKLFVTLSRGSIVACDTMSCTGNWGKVSGLLGACRVLASVLFTDSLLCKFMFAAAADYQLSASSSSTSGGRMQTALTFLSATD
jgi:hypothetical protein